MTPAVCPKCGGAPFVSSAWREFGFTIACSDCYDGPEDRFIASGLQYQDAVEDWNEIVDDWIEEHDVYPMDS